MKRSIVGLLLLVVVAGVMPAFAKRHHDIKVAINKEVAAKGGLKIRFVDMIEDSRCPSDAQCIWAGNAKIKVQISRVGEKAETFELNTGAEPQSVVVAGYEIKLIGLTPEPASNIRIRKDGYVATFTVIKNR